jgi:hypothetical protein
VSVAVLDDSRRQSLRFLVGAASLAFVGASAGRAQALDMEAFMDREVSDIGCSLFLRCSSIRHS